MRYVENRTCPTPQTPPPKFLQSLSPPHCNPLEREQVGRERGGAVYVLVILLLTQRHMLRIPNYQTKLG
jgi:hypothetical protein